MRILLVSSAYRPYISGVGEHVYHLGLQLQNLGHDVHILTTTYRSTKEKVEILSATRVGKGILLPFAQGQFTLPIGFHLITQTKHFIATHDFDIVHCHGIFPPDLAYWAALYSQYPVVVTFHTVTPKLPDSVCSSVGRILHKIAGKIRAKIAVSNASRYWAEKFFPGEFQIIPNGVDIKIFHPDVPPVINDSSGPIILFVGRLEKRKGLDVLLYALSDIIKVYPKAKLLVVGSGPLNNYYRKLAGKLDISDAIIFAGPVSNDVLPGYYTSATVFVAPTVGREAMGIVLVEAMACGRPVIASHITGYREIIADGINGILAPPGDSKLLARAVIALLDSESFRMNLAYHARRRAEDFDWEKIARKIEQVYLKSIK